MPTPPPANSRAKLRAWHVNHTRPASQSLSQSKHTNNPRSTLQSIHPIPNPNLSQAKTNKLTKDPSLLAACASCVRRLAAIGSRVRNRIVPSKRWFRHHSRRTLDKWSVACDRCLPKMKLPIVVLVVFLCCTLGVVEGGLRLVPSCLDRHIDAILRDGNELPTELLCPCRPKRRKNFTKRIARLTTLTSLDLSDCRMTGTIPKELALLTGLTSL
jgi:hypothetical protein